MKSTTHTMTTAGPSVLRCTFEPNTDCFLYNVQGSGLFDWSRANVREKKIGTVWFILIMNFYWISWTFLCFPACFPFLLCFSNLFVIEKNTDLFYRTWCSCRRILFCLHWSLRKTTGLPSYHAGLHFRNVLWVYHKSRIINRIKLLLYSIVVW